MPVKNPDQKPETAPQGSSPVHLAAQLGKPELLSLLLELEAWTGSLHSNSDRAPINRVTLRITLRRATLIAAVRVTIRIPFPGLGRRGSGVGF